MLRFSRGSTDFGLTKRTDRAQGWEIKPEIQDFIAKAMRAGK